MPGKITDIWRLGNPNIDPSEQPDLADLYRRLRSLERTIENIQLFIEAMSARNDAGFVLNPDAATNSLRVGIGTETPSADLDVAGNLALNGATPGTSADGAVVLTNGTEPADSPADTVQLFSVDAAAGEATLGLRTEAPVVTEAVASDRTLKVKINGTVYKVLLQLVP